MNHHRLEPPHLRHRKAFMRMLNTYGSETFSSTKEATSDFDGFVRRLCRDADGIDISPDWVPTSHFWFFVDEEIVGTLRIRHYLTPAVEERAGHIGYDIAPPFRGRGFGHEILRLGLIEARKIGITDVLAICAENNFASRRILESQGAEVGKFSAGEVWYWLRAAQPNKSAHATARG